MSDLGAFNLEPGQMVGGYTLVSRLGSGAMGSVWRVQDGGGTVYAMKILRDSLSEESNAKEGGDEDDRERVTARERLRREAMALRKIRHPGVCTIVDMELDDSLAFIVTSLIEGKNLREDVASNGPYRGDDLERLASRLTEAVKAVHQAGIVHRDIKPTNVMISVTGPVLVDFGIAMGEGESHVTRTGLVMGTPGFIAPEVIDGAESSEATDWWSVASVLAFAATGKPVFGTKPMMAVLERAASGNANLTGLPSATMKAFRSALNPHRQERCSPDELLTAIASDAYTLPDYANSGEAMPPFEQDDPTRRIGSPQETMILDGGNPRTLWRGDDAIRSSESQGSRMGVLDGAQDHAPDGAPTATLPPVRSEAGQTALLDQGDDPHLRQSLRGEASTEAMPTAPPPPQPEQVALTQVLQPTRTLSPTQVPPPTQVLPPTQTFPPTQVPPPAIPAARTDPAIPAQPVVMYNPADVKRQAYLARGVLPLFLAAIPLGLLAAYAPAISFLVSSAVLWAVLTAGLSMTAQLRREERRSGERRKTDTAMQIASLPWHCLKALALSIPRIVLSAIVFIAGSLLLGFVLGTGREQIGVSIASFMIHVPIITGAPLSMCGVTLAGCSVLSWLTAVFTFNSALTRVGAGSLVGLPVSDIEPSPYVIQPPEGQGAAVDIPSVRRKSPAPRQIPLLIVWFVLVVAATGGLLVSLAVDWTPLVLSTL